MVNGMYVSPERVVRGGFLVAFKGEVMGIDEAARRGLVAEAAPEKKPARRSGRSRKAEK